MSSENAKTYINAPNAVTKSGVGMAWKSHNGMPLPKSYDPVRYEMITSEDYTHASVDTGWMSEDVFPGNMIQFIAESSLRVYGINIDELRQKTFQ